MGKLADANQQAMPADNELRVGTVKQLVSPTTGAADAAYVSFSPDPNAAPSRCSSLTSYAPVVGDVVQVLRQGSQFLILGPAAPRGNVGRWITVASNPGWSSPWGDFGGGFGACRYMLDPNGFVEFAGSAKTSGAISSGSVLFVMPAAYRPASGADEVVGVTFDSSLGGSAAARLTFQGTSGNVVLTSFSGSPTVTIMSMNFRYPSAALA